MEPIDTTTGYVMQQGSKERQTVSLCQKAGGCLKPLCSQRRSLEPRRWSHLVRSDKQERAQETWAMAGRGPRSAIARVESGNARPTVVRACALRDPWAGS